MPCSMFHNQSFQHCNSILAFSSMAKWHLTFLIYEDKLEPLKIVCLSTSYPVEASCHLVHDEIFWEDTWIAVCIYRAILDKVIQLWSYSRFIIQWIFQELENYSNILYALTSYIDHWEDKMKKRLSYQKNTSVLPAWRPWWLMVNSWNKKMC